MTLSLTPHEQAFWHAWKVASERVRDNIAADIKAATGLSDQDFGVLTRLVDLGQGALRQNKLAASMGWHRTRISHQLTRMEQRDLLRRSSRDDGVLVTISPEGRRLVDVARPVHAAAIRTHLLEHTRSLDSEALLLSLKSLGA